MILEIALSFATLTPSVVIGQPTTQSLAFGHSVPALSITEAAQPVITTTHEGISLSTSTLAAVLTHTSATTPVFVFGSIPVGLSVEELTAPEITLVDSTPTVTLNDPADVCSSGTDMEFTATPTGGVYSSTGAGLTDHGDGTATLDVSAAGPGEYDITYTVSFCGCCSASKTVTVQVLSCSIDISGRIIWEKNYLTTQEGVSLVTCTLSGDSALSDDSDTTGYYEISPATGTNFVITPLKNRSVADGALNGLTAADASRIQQHVNGVFPIVGPYKLIAADVNNSKSVTVQDAFLITQAVLGNPVAQSLFISRTWVFVPKSYVFPDPQNPWSMGPPYFPQSITLTGVSDQVPDQDFIACKLGDVNSTALPTFKSMATPFSLRVSDRVVAKGEVFTADFITEGVNSFLALQFAMSYDNQSLQVVQIKSPKLSLIQPGSFGMYTPGEIRVAVSNTESGSFAGKAFSVKFKALKAGRLSDLLRLDSKILPPKTFSGSYTEGPLTLQFSK